MNRRFWTIALVAGLACFGSAGASASSRTDSAFEAASWLARQQETDGGFFSSNQRADLTAETLASVVAGGVGGKTIDRAFTHIKQNGKRAAKRGGFTGRIVAGIVAGGGNPASFGGVNYVKILRAQYSGGAHDSTQFFDNLLAANGAMAAGETFPAEALTYFGANECSGGGFGYENDCAKGADVDSSAMAIGVLVASGNGNSALVSRARTYLLTQQHSDGGFGFTNSKPTSADSTGLALSAIEALGEDAEAGAWRQPDSDNPVHALAALQQPSGAFKFTAASGGPNTASTINAVPGMAGVAYPVPKGKGREPKPEPSAAPAKSSASSGDGNPAGGDASAPPDGASASRTPDPTPTPSPTPEPTGRAAVDVIDGESQPPPFAGGASESDRPGRSILLSPMLWVGVVSGGTGIGLMVRWWRSRAAL